eukprot:scaffold685827_cov67-Attheya_sp.AAC.1
MEASIVWVFCFPCFSTLSPSTVSPPLPMKLAPVPIQFDFYTVPLHCCHVEDLIELEPATPLLLLIPNDYSSYDDFVEWAAAQMTRHKDESLNVSITNTQSTLIQVTWKAFHACPCGLQIWAKLENPCPIENVFRRFKSENTLNNVFNYLQLHVEGDALHTSMLCSQYHSAMQTVSSSQINTLHIQEERLKDIFFDTNAFSMTMVECDKLFEQYLDQTLVTWNHYGAPLMPPKDVDEMIARVQKSIPNVWDILSDFRGLNTKNSQETHRPIFGQG